MNRPPPMQDVEGFLEKIETLHLIAAPFVKELYPWVQWRHGDCEFTSLPRMALPFLTSLHVKAFDLKIMIPAASKLRRLCLEAARLQIIFEDVLAAAAIVRCVKVKCLD